MIMQQYVTNTNYAIIKISENFISMVEWLMFGTVCCRCWECWSVEKGLDKFSKDHSVMFVRSAEPEL